MRYYGTTDGLIDETEAFQRGENSTTRLVCKANEGGSGFRPREPAGPAERVLGFSLTGVGLPTDDSCDSPANRLTISVGTGFSPSDGLQSHYARLLRATTLLRT
jgi:hypothetical protein